jgi:D-arabinose 1-dehydrogenase-like Zn-dependent alcohol dehydrogenase
VHLAGERIAIFGMGRVGLAAYSVLEDRFPRRAIGFDRDAAQVKSHRSAGRNVVLADATDSDLWERLQVRDGMDLVILAMPKHGANLHAAETVRRHGYKGVLAAVAKFDEEVELKAMESTPSTSTARLVVVSPITSATFFKQQRPDLVLPARWTRVCLGNLRPGMPK